MDGITEWIVKTFNSSMAPEWIIFLVSLLPLLELRGGILAILFSFILMSVYVWVRYRGGYAIGSFISLCLDFVIMFGFFSITGYRRNGR